MEEALGEAIMEEREETMFLPSSSYPVHQTSHFIRPTINNTHLFPPLTKPQIFDARDTPLQVTFKGRQSPQNRWIKWVNLLLPKYRNVWKTAGIYESILISTYKIYMQEDLVIALAERWCLDTNTFMFPWGESTITLEDMVILGGYSVFGDPVFTPLCTNEMRNIDEKLINTHSNIKLMTGKEVGINVWMDLFMNQKDPLEHEAFLALWLSWFVFPLTHPRVGKFVFPIAIHLSRGTPLALAPAVLASIYRDLSRLKNMIPSCSNKVSIGANEDEKVTLFAPLQFLQVWAWERFPAIQPAPNVTGDKRPRFAMWHRLKNIEVGDIRTALDTAGSCFQWRPYCGFTNDWQFNKFYKEKAEWIMVQPWMDKEIETHVTWVRPSELVGLECEEQYLPHRVARQFGLDQDIPAFVPRFNHSQELAWINYTREISDKKIFISACLYEPGVTVRYSTWWDRAMREDRIKSFSRKPRSKSRKRASRACWGLSCNGDMEVDPFIVNETADKPNSYSVTAGNIENKNLGRGAVDPSQLSEIVDSSKIHLVTLNNIENKRSSIGVVDTSTVNGNVDTLKIDSVMMNNIANITSSGEVDFVKKNENLDSSENHSVIMNNIENKTSIESEVDPLTLNEYANIWNKCSLITNDTENKNSTSGKVDVQSLDIEARLTRLEILVAILKGKQLA